MYSDRNDILMSQEFIGQVRIAICDWVNYWAINGTAVIENETLREQTDSFITAYLIKPELFVQKVAYLAISEAVVKDAVTVTDQNVTTAVNTVLANALSYLM